MGDAGVAMNELMLQQHGPDAIPFWYPKCSELMRMARTLRERVFVALYIGRSSEGLISLKLKGTLPIDTIKQKSLRCLIAAVRRIPKSRQTLTRIPFRESARSYQGEEQLCEHLQDLANIVSWEASEAFNASYYPRPLDVLPLDDDHVKAVMYGMQREMVREGIRTSTAPAVFADLPWDRQVALAERRRYWFAQFGITPAAWKRGTFSLWRVSNMIYPPEGYYCGWDEKVTSSGYGITY
jgi:hypothetical protein